jgi:hypothetical protein
MMGPLVRELSKTKNKKEARHQREMERKLVDEKRGKKRRTSGSQSLEESEDGEEGVQQEQDAGVCLEVEREEDMRIIKEHPDLLDHLVNLYFTFAFPIIPCVHQTRFLKLFKAQRVPKLLLYSMCCVTARFSDHALITAPRTEAGEPFFRHARELLRRCFDDIPTVWQIQSLLLLGFHQFGAGRAASALTLSNMGIQKAIQSGLNAESNFDKWLEQGRCDHEQVEEMRMVWWTAVCIDVGCSATSGNPVLISDQFQVRYPNVQDFYFGVVAEAPVSPASFSPNPPPSQQQPQPQCFFGYLTQLIMICRRILGIVNNPAQQDSNDRLARVDDINRDLDAFYRTLPNYLQLVHVPDVGWRIKTQFAATLNVLFFQARIVLNRPECMTRTFNEACATPAFKMCTRAAESISHICHLFDYHNPPVVHPIVSYMIYTASTVLAFGSMSPRPDVVLNAKNNLEILSNALSRVHTHWGLAKKCSIIVKDFIAQNVASVMNRMGTRGSQPDTPPSQPRMVFSGVRADSTGVVYFTVLQGPGQKQAHVTTDFLATENESSSLHSFVKGACYDSSTASDDVITPLPSSTSLTQASHVTTSELSLEPSQIQLQMQDIPCRGNENAWNWALDPLVFSPPPITTTLSPAEWHNFFVANRPDDMLMLYNTTVDTQEETQSTPAVHTHSQTHHRLPGPSFTHMPQSPTGSPYSSYGTYTTTTSSKPFTF